MSDDVSDAEVREKILAQFQARWEPEEAERRVALLEEIIPQVPEYAKLHNQRVDIKVHPEHLEHYIMYLQPRIRAIIENVGPPVIDMVYKSHSPDERLAKVIRLVNLMDEKAAANKKAAEDADASPES